MPKRTHTSDGRLQERRPRFAARWLAALMFCAVVTSGAEKSAPDAGVFLIVDYLPCAVYAGDEIALNVRVENSGGAAVACELVLSATPLDGETPPPQTRKFELAARGFHAAGFSLASSDVTAFMLTLNAGGTATALKVDVLHDREPWPKTRVRGGAWETETEARVVWAPVRREKKLDRAFLPMKWLLGDGEKKKNGGTERTDAAVFLPAGYANEKAATELGPYLLDGSAPVLSAARAVLEQISVKKSVVVALPPEDLDAATDPRVYRVAMDGLLTRLRGAGVQRIALLPPFRYGVPTERMKVFWKETAEACATYQARYVDPGELTQESFWRVDPARAGVYGGKPNAAGRKRMDEMLGELDAERAK